MENKDMNKVEQNESQEPRKNFAETIDTMSQLGISTSTVDSQIKLGIYDPYEGYNVLDAINMDKYNALRLFGNLFVYAIEIEDNMMKYILVAPEEV